MITPMKVKPEIVPALAVLAEKEMHGRRRSSWAADPWNHNVHRPPSPRVA
jgi:hypothetical protein